MIGVAFQSLTDSDIENIGYVVPINIITHFLEDVRRHGNYSGVCTLGAKLQGMENINLRNFYGMNHNDSGVIVVSVNPLSPAINVLKSNDIILSIDSIRIANDATISFQEGGKYLERVLFNNYLSQLFPNDIIKLEILRNHTKMNLSLPVFVSQSLIPSVLLQRKQNTKHTTNIMGVDPSYLVIGGMVFTTLTKEYLDSSYDLREMTNVDDCSNEFQLLSLINSVKKGVNRLIFHFVSFNRRNIFIYLSSKLI